MLQLIFEKKIVPETLLLATSFTSFGGWEDSNEGNGEASANGGRDAEGRAQGDTVEMS